MKKYKFMLEAKTSEGQTIWIDGEFVIGSRVFSLSPEGEKITAPDGQLTLEDGTVFEVKGGAIESITDVEEEMTQEPAPAPTAPTEPAPATFNAEEKYTALEMSINEIKESLKSLTEKFTTESAVNNEKFSQIVTEPKQEKVNVIQEKKLPSLKALFQAMEK